MKTERVLAEWTLSAAEHRLRILVRDIPGEPPVSLERRGEDLFVVGPDSRVLAALIRLDSPATQVA